jgi:hypothetical protein
MVRVRLAVRTGRQITRSTPRLPGMPAAELAEDDPPPQVARELAHLLRQGHWLIEIGQEPPERASVCHGALSFLASAGSVPRRLSFLQPGSTGSGARRVPACVTSWESEHRGANTPKPAGGEPCGARDGTTRFPGAFRAGRRQTRHAGTTVLPRCSSLCRPPPPSRALSLPCWGRSARSLLTPPASPSP